LPEGAVHAAKNRSRQSLLLRLAMKAREKRNMAPWAGAGHEAQQFAAVCFY